MWRLEDLGEQAPDQATFLTGCCDSTRASLIWLEVTRRVRGSGTGSSNSGFLALEDEPFVFESQVETHVMSGIFET